jgi:hypothetical protein
MVVGRKKGGDQQTLKELKPINFQTVKKITE